MRGATSQDDPMGANDKGGFYWLYAYVVGGRAELEEAGTDRCGRTVWHVYVNRVWVNGALVRCGFA